MAISILSRSISCDLAPFYSLYKEQVFPDFLLPKPSTICSRNPDSLRDISYESWAGGPPGLTR